MQREASAMDLSSEGRDKEDLEDDTDPQANPERKRLIFEEARHLLGLPEYCLVLCWLGDQDGRNPDEQIADFSRALEKVTRL